MIREAKTENGWVRGIEADPFRCMGAAGTIGVHAAS